ncbi:MAG: hypothetical protein H8K03_17860 [Nitrospira sp.]
MTDLQRKIITKTQEIILRSPKRIYTKAELETLYQDVFFELSEERRYPQHSRERFVSLILEQELFKILTLNSPYENTPIRYAHGDASRYELAFSIHKNAYLSHGTAAFLNGLTTEESSTIYVNKEQSSKPRSESQLTQQALNLAFSREQRRSKFILRHGSTRITLLSGKNTNRLGVQQGRGKHGELLEWTEVERTLIDITVRPGYAGGINKVMQCYKAARKTVQSTELIRILKALDYVYPYHQAIGFYLQMAGLEEESWSALRAQGLRYDFYLIHGAKTLKYDPYWRIFYPADLSI